MEPPFGHMTFMNKSWITRIFCSHTLSLPTDEGKLARNRGLGILFREKDNHANTMGFVYPCIFIYYYIMETLSKQRHLNILIS